MKKKPFKTPEEEIEAIRQEPAFRALVEELKGTEPATAWTAGDLG